MLLRAKGIGEPSARVIRPVKWPASPTAEGADSVVRSQPGAKAIANMSKTASRGEILTVIGLSLSGISWEVDNRFVGFMKS